MARGLIKKLFKEGTKKVRINTLLQAMVCVIYPNQPMYRKNVKVLALHMLCLRTWSKIKPKSNCFLHWLFLQQSTISKAGNVSYDENGRQTKEIKTLHGCGLVI